MKLELLTECFSWGWHLFPLMEIVTSLIAMHIAKSVSQKKNICSLPQEWRASGERLWRTCHRKPSNEIHMMMLMVVIITKWKYGFSFSLLKNAKSIISTTCWKKTDWPLLQQWQLYRLCWEAWPHFTNWEFCWQITTCIFVMFYRSESYRASVFKVRTCLMAFSLSGEQTQPHSSECGEEVPGRLRLPCRQCVRSW